MGYKLKIIGLVGILFVSMLLLPSSVNAQEGTIPVAKIVGPMIENPIGFADVDPASNGTVVFTGTLEVSCQWATITEIEVSCDKPDWTVTISPAAVGLEAGSPATAVVSVIVKVPQETDFDKVGKISIKGETRTATPWGYDTDFSYELTVGVNPYYVMTIGSATPYKELPPHTITTLDITVRSLGNAMVNDLKVSIENENELKGWVVLLPASALNISGGESQTVSIKIETATDWTLWKDNVQRIVVKIESETAGVSETYTVYIRQKGTYIPGFDPMFVLIALCMITLILKKRRR